MIVKNITLNLHDLRESLSFIKNKFLLLPHKVETYRRGEVIYHQGDRIDKIGLLLEGVMKCATYTNHGDELNPHYFYEGEIFPEYLLLTGEKEYIYTLIAEKRSVVIFVDFHHFEELIMNDMNWCQFLITYMAKRGLLSEKWRLCNCYGNLRSKIAFMLLEIYGGTDDDWIEIKDCQRIVSTKLQISRTAYNQEMIKLEEENIIKRNRSSVKILDYRKLAGYI